MIKQPELTELLRQEWQLIPQLCGELSPEQWDIETSCPTWSVKDQISHMVGTERMLLGDDTPDIEVPPMAHVKNEIAANNEKWLAHYRPMSPAQLLGEFTEVTDRRVVALQAMTQADFDAPSWTPAGQDTYGRFMRIRLFDCWVHEQDIREATNMPGHMSGDVVDMIFAEVRQSMGFVVGKLGGAPEGSKVEFRLERSESQPILLRIERPKESEPKNSSPKNSSPKNSSPKNSSHCQVVDKFSEEGSSESEPTASIAMDFALFTRLIAGRKSSQEALDLKAVELGGDMEVATRITQNLAYVF